MSNISDVTMKCIIAGLTTVVLDKFAIGEPDITKSIMFGCPTAASIYGAYLIASSIPDNFKSQYINGKKLEADVLEIGTAVGLNYAIATNVTGSIPGFLFYEKIGVILASDLIATYSADYIAGRPLSFTS